MAYNTLCAEDFGEALTKVVEYLGTLFVRQQFFWNYGGDLFSNICMTWKYNLKAKNGLRNCFKYCIFTALPLMVQNVPADKMQFISCKRPPRGMQYRNFPKTRYFGFPFYHHKKNPFGTRGLAYSKSYFIYVTLWAEHAAILIYNTYIETVHMQLGAYIHMQVTHFSYRPLLHLPPCFSASLTFVRIPIVNLTAVVPHCTTSCSASNTSASI